MIKRNRRRERMKFTVFLSDCIPVFISELGHPLWSWMNKKHVAKWEFGLLGGMLHCTICYLVIWFMSSDLIEEWQVHGPVMFGFLLCVLYLQDKLLKGPLWSVHYGDWIFWCVCRCIDFSCSRGFGITPLNIGVFQYSLDWGILNWCSPLFTFFAISEAFFDRLCPWT